MASSTEHRTIKVMSCTQKGKRCTALAKDRTKWIYDAISEVEAELMCEAVADRGWVTSTFWRIA
jgi:hypothetical protein